MARVWRVAIGGHFHEADVIVHPEQQWLAKASHKATQTVATVITEHRDQEVTWNRYSDSRFNGCVPLEQLQEEWPNLEHLGETRLRGNTLGSILRDELEINPDADQIHLYIYAGKPLDILKGADSWVNNIKAITLKGHQSTYLLSESLAKWLDDQGFRNNATDQLTWAQDQQLRDTILERDLLRERVQTLEERMTTIIHELDQILALIDRSMMPEPP